MSNEEKANWIYPSTSTIATLKCSNETIKLPKEQISIGRNTKSDIILTNPSISKEHALIYFIKEDIVYDAYIKDLNSSNGTYINDLHLKNNSVSLKNGDRIMFGKDSMIYEFEFNNKSIKEDEGNFVNEIKGCDKKISLINENQYEPSKINHLTTRQSPYINTLQPDFTQFQTSSSLIMPLSLTTRNNNSHHHHFQPTEHFYTSSSNKNKEDEEKQNQNIVLEKELNGCKSKVNHITALFDQLTEEYIVLSSKHTALMVYSSDLQKKIDSYEKELKNMKLNPRYKLKSFDKPNEINEIINEKDQLILSLQYEVSYYKNKTIETQSSNRNNNELITKFDKLIESYIKTRT